jgi:hypothetical protein
VSEKHEKNMFLEAARRAVRKVGWNPRVDLDVLDNKPADSLGSPSYGYRSGIVRLQYSPGLLARLTRVRSDLMGDDLGDPRACLDAVVASRVYMASGGYKICPYSTYDYAGILEASADGMRSAGASEAEALEFSRPIASFFIASVVAGVSATSEPDPGTFRCGWPLDQIISVPEDATLPNYSALYSNIQLRLWIRDGEIAKALRSRFPRPFDALDFETERGVAILLDTFELSGDGRDGLAWAEEGTREFIIDALKYDYRSWPIKAFQFAELFTPYAICNEGERPQPPPPQAGQPNSSGRPSFQAEERRALVQSPEMPTQQAVQESETRIGRSLTGAPPDSFYERFERDAQFRRRVLSSGVGKGINPLKFHMSFESLDALYRGRVAKVEIECETVTRAGTAIDVAHMTRQKLGDSLPSLNCIDWGATRFDAGGELELYKKDLPITDQRAGAAQMNGFPDLLFVVDSSGSMGWDPKSGQGPYDSLLRAIYSVFAFLEEQNKAQHMRFAAINFSATTLCTAWKSYSELNVVKRLLFRHQGGGTVFASAPLEATASNSLDRFLCLMVTDGQISNQGDVVRVVGNMISKGNDFAHIQIGRETPLVEHLRQINVPVHVIADHTELDGLCLEYTRNTWGPGGSA